MTGTFWNTVDQTYHVDHLTAYFLHVVTNKLIYFGFWSGVFLVAFILYTLFTSSTKRKTSIFRLHTFILPLTILFNVDQMIFWYKTFHIAWYKQQESASKSEVDYLVISNEILIHLLPLLAESTLLLQISSFFPPSLYSIWFRFGIIAPFVLLLIARFILSVASATFVILAWDLATWVPNSPFPVIPFSEWLEKARTTALVEYILGMLYCSSASSFLLYKAYKFVHSSKIADRPPIERKLRFLTETIFMCFLPPAALTIAGVAARMKKTSNMGKTLYEQEKVVSSLVNVSVLFALLATTWSSVRSYADEKVAHQKLEGNGINAMVDSIPLVESERGNSQRGKFDCQQHGEAQDLVYDEI